MARQSGSANSGVRSRRDTSAIAEKSAARAVIVIALILEVQGPRFAGGLRLLIAIFVVAAALALLARLYRGHDPFRAIASWPMGAFVAYVAWCLISAIWSAVPSETFLQSGLLLLSLLLALSYADMSREVFAIEFIKVAVVLSVVSWAMVPVLPDVAVLPDVTWRLNGPLQHPQRLSLFVGLALILGVALKVSGRRIFTSRRNSFLAFGILLTTLGATQARANTVFVALVVGAVVFKRAEIWQKILLLAALFATILVVSFNVDVLLAAVDREGSNTLTLTGRTRTWEAASEMIEIHPEMGYGFASFFSPLTEHFFTSGYVTPHAHNTWVNATFETGFIGAGLLTLFLLGSLLSRGSSGRANYLSWPAVLFAVMAGLMGIVFGGKVTTMSIIVMIMVGQAAHVRQKDFANAKRRRWSKISTGQD
ncbi:O-antigen ligase family protein [Microbacterium sp. A204]|uniref:O-antigen ligase family protein n=1 Tax=Microbacterium sp. A204 TaxID=3457321 RepID=UPI003FD113F5